MGNGADSPRLVYLSPVPWSSFEQRPHFLVREFIRQTGGRVLWIDPTPGRLPRWRDLYRPRPADQTPGRGGCPPVQVLRPRALPIEPLGVLGGLNAYLWRPALASVRQFAGNHQWTLAIGKPGALAASLLRTFRPDLSFYDAMDDFPEFYSGRSRDTARRLEAEIADRVDRIWVTSRYLERKFSASRRTLLVPNACDPESMPAPTLHRVHPTVYGYVGTIGDWFDWNVVRLLAEEDDTCEVRLIGPVFARPSRSLPGNVKLLGSCPHGEIGHNLTRFTAGIIPFRINTLTRAVNPIKYYEYRAMGLPVLTTPFGEMTAHAAVDKGVFFLESAGSNTEAIARALSFRETDPEVCAFREANRWSVRFDFTPETQT